MWISAGLFALVVVPTVAGAVTALAVTRYLVRGSAKFVRVNGGYVYTFYKKNHR